MTTIRFIPIFEDEEFIAACHDYDEIWKSDGQNILVTFTEVTGLELREARIAALVYEGMSFSGRDRFDAMKLRASYEYDVKKGTLVHELGHRLTFKINHPTSEDAHEFLNLFLYDVWERLYGKEFADKMVLIESSRTKMYKSAWEYALGMDFNQRQEKLHNTRSSSV